MHNFVVRIYRTNPEDAGLISGIIENIESGQKEIFHSFHELQSILANSIGNSKFGSPDIEPQELSTHENVAVIG